ncbi:MAG: hypothetical protein WC616_04345 [Candidatus Omnitrophota bacterium]
MELNLSNYFARMASGMAVDNFRPVHLRYFSYDSLNNSFKVLLDKGTNPKQVEQQLKAETKELLKYFLIGVTLPNDKFWVNLRPDSPKQIIDFNLEETDIGKIMLEADLQLKKDTAAFTSPQTPEGKEYWNRLYKKAEEIYGQENITIPTLTRPWIIPNEIIVRETKDSAYVYKATLKVMLESDYLKNSPGAINSAVDYTFKDERSKALNEYSSQLIRELIIPKLTKEVNLSKRYAPLRQVYYSLILSRWFKSRFQQVANRHAYSLQNGTVPDFVSLIDKNDLTNLTSKTDWSKTTYFNEYKKSFAQGEYNIQEPIYTPSGQTIRSYFSGGMDFTVKTMPQGMPNGFASSSLTFDRRLPKTFIPVMGNGLRLWLDNPKNRQAAASLVTTHTPDELLRITKEIRSELNRERIRFRNREEAKAAISRILRNGDISGGEANRVKSLFKTRRQKIWSLTEAWTVEFDAVIPGEKYANEILARFAPGFLAEGDIHVMQEFFLYKRLGIIDTEQHFPDQKAALDSAQLMYPLELSKLQPFFKEPASLYYFIDALGGLATSNGNITAPKIFAALDAYFIGLITQEDLRKAIGEIPEGSAALGLYDCIERLKVIAVETTGSKVSSSAVEEKPKSHKVTTLQSDGYEVFDALINSSIKEVIRQMFRDDKLQDVALQIDYQIFFRSHLRPQLSDLWHELAPARIKDLSIILDTLIVYIDNYRKDPAMRITSLENKPIERDLKVSISHLGEGMIVYLNRFAEKGNDEASVYLLAAIKNVLREVKDGLESSDASPAGQPDGAKASSAVGTSSDIMSKEEQRRHNRELLEIIKRSFMDNKIRISPDVNVKAFDGFIKYLDDMVDEYLYEEFRVGVTLYGQAAFVAATDNKSWSPKDRERLADRIVFDYLAKKPGGIDSLQAVEIALAIENMLDMTSESRLLERISAIFRDSLLVGEVASSAFKPRVLSWPRNIKREEVFLVLEACANAVLWVILGGVVNKGEPLEGYLQSDNFREEILDIIRSSDNYSLAKDLPFKAYLIPSAISFVKDNAELFGEAIALYFEKDGKVVLDVRIDEYRAVKAGRQDELNLGAGFLVHSIEKYLEMAKQSVRFASSALNKENIPQIERSQVAPGGIDFKSKAMSSATIYQTFGSFAGLDFNLPKLSSSALLSFNLDKESSSISQAIDNGILISGARIKEFMAASANKGEFDQRRDIVLLWLAKLGILEESMCCTQESSREYREALVIADS